MSGLDEKEVFLSERLARIEHKVDEVWEGVQAVRSFVEPKRTMIVGAPLESTDVRTVFAHWVDVMGKNPKTTKLTPERRRVVQARLKEGYSVEFICTAVYGCESSDFHMARGEHRGGKRFNDLTLICRNGSTLERFEEMTEPGYVDDGSAWR